MVAQFSSLLVALVLDAHAGDPLLTLGWSVTADQVDAYLGTTVSTAGDVNGDGYGDVVVYAMHLEDTKREEGSALVFLGSATGLETTPAWAAVGDEEGAYIMGGGTTAGDVNGDGYGDLIVGAVAYDLGKGQYWKAYLYLGSPTGLDTTAAWSASTDEPDDLGYMPQSMASAGDVNGDGYDDVLVADEMASSPEAAEGKAYLYLGSAAGLGSVPAWSAESNQVAAWLGTSVASAGDVNGDGYDDVVVGAKGYDDGDTNEGAAWLYLGSAGGLDVTAAWTAQGDLFDARMGYSVSSAGDVNGDGYDDVVVGAPALSDSADLHEGRAYVYLGSATGLASKAAWTAQGEGEDAWLGTSVSAAGDVNADGFDDVVVGAFGWGSSSEGQVSVFLGSATGLGTAAAWTVEGDHSDAQFGSWVSTAGDVDGDGSDDVIVGAPEYEIGSTVHGAAFVYVGEGGAGPDTDADDDGVDDDEDCDDANADVYPGATEVCDDGIDNDCDNSVDEDCGDDSGGGDAGGGGDDGDASDSSGEDDPGCGCGGPSRGGEPAFLMMIAAAAIARRRAHT